MTELWFILLLHPALTLLPGAPDAGLSSLPFEVKVPRDGWKNGGDDPYQCISIGTDGEYILTQPEDIEGQCMFSVPPYGVFVRLEYGSMIVRPLEGAFEWGVARFYTAGAPFKIEGHTHLIVPEDVVEVGVENSLTIIRSKTGFTQILACEMSSDSGCAKNEFMLLEGDLIALMNDGRVYAWENSGGDDVYPKGGSCSAGSASQPDAVLIFVLLFLFAAAWRKRL